MSVCPPRFLRFAWHPSWHPSTHVFSPTEPCIILIHGLMAGRHMQHHWLACLRDWGYRDVTLFGNHRPLSVLRSHAQIAACQGRPIVILGYSQGGFQALKLAGLLADDQITVNILVMIASGGLGRFYPAQWRTNPRKIPSNVQYAAHFYAQGDVLGTDLYQTANQLYATHTHTEIQNYCFDATSHIDHFSISRAAPHRALAPLVEQAIIRPLQKRLEKLHTPPDIQSGFSHKKQSSTIN